MPRTNNSAPQLRREKPALHDVWFWAPAPATASPPVEPAPHGRRGGAAAHAATAVTTAAAAVAPAGPPARTADDAAPRDHERPDTAAHAATPTAREAAASAPTGARHRDSCRHTTHSHGPNHSSTITSRPQPSHRPYARPAAATRPSATKTRTPDEPRSVPTWTPFGRSSPAAPPNTLSRVTSRASRATFTTVERHPSTAPGGTGRAPKTRQRGTVAADSLNTASEPTPPSPSTPLSAGSTSEIEA